jgi:hypothetical protein
MDKELQLKALEEFRDYVISKAKSNLRNKKSTGNLSQSLNAEVKVMPNSIRFFFEMAEYGFYQDKGVSGTRKKYDTEFSYTTKAPPPKAFDKWIVRKGIAPRDQSGKFLTRKSLQFALSRYIFVNGIKPSLFFTKPFETAFKNLPDELIEAYGLESEELFDTIMKENFRNYGY